MLVERFEKKQVEKLKGKKKSEIKGFNPGDTVRVNYKITEGKTTRIQAFEGVVIAKSKSPENFNATFTVRKISKGVGVERTFLIHSPFVDSIVVMKKGDVRRSKLYYLRNLKGKAARIREKMMFDKKNEKEPKKEEITKVTDKKTEETREEIKETAETIKVEEEINE
ncbi:50S ribosomal protein L19 [Pseudomonadota bacterium]